MSRIPTVFMASDPIALPALDTLVQPPLSEQFELRAVYTQPDRRHGRGLKLKPNAIKEWALGQGIMVRQPERLRRCEELPWLRQTGCSLLLVMAYGKILRRWMLDFPSLGALNFHGSILPAYRGASPIVGSLASGDGGSGVTLMRMEEALDSGPAAAVETVVVRSEDRAPDLHSRLADAAATLCREALPALSGSGLLFREQDDSRASYTRLITGEDREIDLGAPAMELANRVRALFPWPGVQLHHEAMELKIGRAVALEEVIPRGEEPGTILAAGPEGIDVACGQGGILRLLEIQKPGARMLPAAQFLQGHPLRPGDRLRGGGAMRPLVSSSPFPG